VSHIPRLLPAYLWAGATRTTRGGRVTHTRTLELELLCPTALAHSTRTKSTDPVYGSTCLLPACLWAGAVHRDHAGRCPVELRAILCPLAFCLLVSSRLGAVVTPGTGRGGAVRWEKAHMYNVRLLVRGCRWRYVVLVLVGRDAVGCGWLR